jgi:hypothetical protein
LPAGASRIGGVAADRAADAVRTANSESPAAGAAMSDHSRGPAFRGTAPSAAGFAAGASAGSGGFTAGTARGRQDKKNQEATP